MITDKDGKFFSMANKRHRKWGDQFIMREANGLLKKKRPIRAERPKPTLITLKQQVH